MIQRIQSLFLLLAAGGLGALFAFPFASTPTAVEGSVLFADTAYSVFDNPVLMGFFAVAALLALISIFLFKNRTLQVRLSIFSFITALLGLIVAVIFFLQDPFPETEYETIQDQLGLYLPLGAMVLLLLAMRFIRKDDKLVRSMDRLR
jgi:protein-S-isoprenylcysteine O-methyltransferase Ste14